MSDRRLTPANGRVAASYLRTTHQAETYVDGALVQVTTAVADLLDKPDGRRERQSLIGADLRRYEDRDGWSFVQGADGYVGYMRSAALGPIAPTTHFVGTLATHAYESESFKARDLMHLPFGAQVQVLAERHKFYETTLGYIPKKHLRPNERPFTDPATVAQLHFGVPYLWGGNSTLGLDCSGLISAALGACGIACAGDADLQEAQLGVALAADAPLMRGDIVFWKGHVGMMVDEATLIHANAHHMAVVYEPINNAMLRIETQGDGPVTSRKRLA